MFVAEVEPQRAPDVDPDAAASGREEEGLGRLIYAVAAMRNLNPRAVLTVSRPMSVSQGVDLRERRAALALAPDL